MTGNKIENVSEFAPNMGVITFDATVIEIIHEGKKDEKKPIVATLKLETTGENFKISSWNFDLLEPLKKMSRELTIAHFEGSTTLYKDALQIRLGKIKEFYLTESKQKVIINVKSVREQVTKFIKNNINDPVCLNLLTPLILDNDDFFKWPAAKNIHHNYPGGLAWHSLSTARHVLNYYSIYGGECFDLQAALTAALLHDIGKLTEYTEDCEKSFFGNFTTHLVSGVVIVDRCISEWEMTEREQKVVTIVKHTIQSHHEKLEFGSPVTPKLTEAILVSMADLTDSRLESVFATYRNMNDNLFSDNMMVLDGGRFYKWK